MIDLDDLMTTEYQVKRLLDPKHKTYNLCIKNTDDHSETQIPVTAVQEKLLYCNLIKIMEHLYTKGK